MTGTSNRYLDERALVNEGSVLFADYGVDVYEKNGGRIVNNGTWDFQGSSYIQEITHSSGSVGSFTNNGTVKKTSGTNRADIQLAFNNNGVVQVDSGTLRFIFSDGVTGMDGGTGTYGVASGARSYNFV